MKKAMSNSNILHTLAPRVRKVGDVVTSSARRVYSIFLDVLASFSNVGALYSGTYIDEESAGLHFSPSQVRTLELLISMIEKECEVGSEASDKIFKFINDIVGKQYSIEDRALFLNGLIELDAFCLEREGKPFHLASASVRWNALGQYPPTLLAGNRPKQRPSKVLNYERKESFFGNMVELVYIGKSI